MRPSGGGTRQWDCGCVAEHLPRGCAGRLAAIGLFALGLWASPLSAEPAPVDPVVPLPAEAREFLSPLGTDVLGEALPAPPITDPSRLRHLEPGVWKYRVLQGARRGGVETMRVEVEQPGESGEAVKLVFDSGEVQHLEVTYDHEVKKLSQLDAGSDRLVVYRPGLVLEPRMAVGESKRVKTSLSTHRGGGSGKVEYRGQLDYTTTYVGAYRVETPAGIFDARLLAHEYKMKIGPAKAHYRSYGFYVDDVGMVAEVSKEKVTALLLYRRSDRAARVLEELPEPSRVADP